MKDFLKLIKKQANNFYFISVFLGIILIIILIVNLVLLYFIKKTAIKVIPFNLPKTVYYPQFEKSKVASLSAEAYLVGDLTSQKIIIGKNIDLHFSPASTTKLMTAIVGLSYFKLNDILTIKSFGITPVIAGFIPGQKFHFLDLLYAMLLPSDNDAAVAVADNYLNGEKNFVRAMNRKALEFHLLNTHFSDPAGLNDDGDYTTPLDLFRLATIAINNPVLKQIVGTPEKIIAPIDESQIFNLQNLNKLLGKDGVFGIKTGYTEDAGEVLITAVHKNGHTLLIVVMKSKDRFADTKNLIENVVDKINYLPIDL